MNLLYLSNAQIPSRSTNALQTMRMCQGFCSAGTDVTLVHPYRLGNRPEGYGGDVWSFYGVKDRFRIVTLPTPLTRRLAGIPWIARPIQAAPLGAYLGWRSRPGQQLFVCYTRSLLAAWLAFHISRSWGDRSACGGIFVEVHDEPRRPRDWMMLTRADRVIAISAALRDRLIEVRPELEGHTWVEHDGVDLQLIDEHRFDREEARRRLGLPRQGPVLVYTGRVNEEKGAAVVLDAAEILQSVGAHVVLVGRVYGESLRKRAASVGNVTLTGFVPPGRVPTYLAAADILLLPSTDGLPYASYTSPLKMFEYMAAKRPIVASDLPVLREVLRAGENALLYPHSSPLALAGAVQRLWEEPSLRSSLAKRAHRDVQTYTWQRRAKRIMSTLHSAAT
jgi:glycosyltransferase involved in cell wall biosynthesis